MNHLYAPLKVTWYLTKACNLSCTHCYNYLPDEDGRPVPGELSFKEVLRIADDLIDAGVVSFLFVGGEPLLRKWFIDLLEYLENKGVRYGFSTNGSLFTISMAERLRKLKGLYHVQFSLDGDEISHDAIRGAGNYNEVIRAADICDNFRINYLFAMTLVNSNKKALDNVLNLCISRECHFSLQSFVPSGRSLNDLGNIIPRSEYKKFMYHILEQTKKGLKLSKFPCYSASMTQNLPWLPEEYPDEISCGAGTSTAIVYENGDLGICDFMREDVAGNLLEKPIEELWNSDSVALKKWRELDNIEGCNTCGYKKKCGYGCRANAFYNYGRLNAWDPACVSHTKIDPNIIISA